MIHYFDVDIAKEYDIPTAVILSNMEHWIEKNRANGDYFHDGRYWVYNSVRAFGKLFPYLSERQIGEVLRKMEENELILKGNFNQNQQDRTCWYTLTNKGISILRDCKMDFTESVNDARACVSNNNNRIVDRYKDRDNIDDDSSRYSSTTPLSNKHSYSNNNAKPKKLFSGQKKIQTMAKIRQLVNVWTNDKELQELVMKFIENIRVRSGYSISLPQAEAIFVEIKKLVSKSDGTFNIDFAKKYVNQWIAKGWRFPYAIEGFNAEDVDAKPKAVKDMSEEQYQKFLEEDLADETF